MNFIGKIFVVLILIMSIVFMTVAAIVYATHRNWEDIAKKRQSDLNAATAEFDQLKSKYNRLEGDLKSQVDAARQQVAKLQTEQGLLVNRNAALNGELEQLKQTQREAIAAVQATSDNNTRLADENTGLRQEVRTVNNKIDTAFAEALAATEKLHQTRNELESATETTQTLMTQTANMRSVMIEEGIDPATPANAVTPRVDGFVSRIARKGSQQLIEVTIGADDGLKVGHTVEIFRGSKYLGRAEILKTAPDRAIGRINPKFQEGRIQERDRVATRLKLS